MATSVGRATVSVRVGGGEWVPLGNASVDFGGCECCDCDCCGVAPESIDATITVPFQVEPGAHRRLRRLLTAWDRPPQPTRRETRTPPWRGRPVAGRRPPRIPRRPVTRPRAVRRRFPRRM
jgi:hypothetical protein